MTRLSAGTRQVNKTLAQGTALGVLIACIALLAIARWPSAPTLSSAQGEEPAAGDLAADFLRTLDAPSVQSSDLIAAPTIRRDLFHWESLRPESETPAPEVIITMPDAPPDAARILHLQGVILGPAPVAVINGQHVRIGDEVHGFRLVRVERRRAALVRDGVAVEIEMPSRQGMRTRQ